MIALPRIAPISGLIAIAFLNVTSAYSVTCTSAYGVASSSVTDSFKGDPTSILTASPNGGGLLARTTRELVLGNTDLADAILSVAVAAKPEQRAAIGSGLGQTALACSHTEPEAAQKLQLLVLSRGTPELIEAFKAVTADVLTTSLGNAQAPAAASAAASPLGGADATLIGGGANDVSQSGTPVGSTTLSPLSAATVVRAFFTTTVPSGGGGGPKTAPGPVAGEGLPALILMTLVGLYLFCRRRRAPMRTE